MLGSRASLAAPGDNAVTTADASRLLDAFEEALEDLRLSYEKYFVGIERRAPAQAHRELKDRMRRLEELRTRSTVVRFRLAGLRARLVTYEYYWTRVLGQIEKGTHRRDLRQRTQRRTQPEAEATTPPNKSPEPEPDAPQARMTELSAPQAPPRVPQGSSPTLRPPPPPPPPVPVPGMRGVEVRRLFQDLVQAKRAAGEDVEGLTERALARKLARELPKLRQQHGGAVKFEVATVAGKVRLRARPVPRVD